MKRILSIATLTIALALCSSCAASTEMDPIVGVWSTPKLGNGDMWLGFTSDGSSTFILNPDKAPGVIVPNPATVIEIYETTGKWTKNGDIYRNTLYRNDKATISRYYKMDASQLIECEESGQPKAGSPQWSRKLPMGKESDSFVKEYIKTKKKALESIK